MRILEAARIQEHIKIFLKRIPINSHSIHFKKPRLIYVRQSRNMISIQACSTNELK